MSAGGSARRSRSREKGALCFEVDRRDGERRRVRLSNTADPSDGGSITALEPDAREYADALPEGPVAGSGEELYDCGDDVPALFCPECGEPTEVGRTCRRSRCPRCWQSWAFDRGTTLAAKVDALRRYWTANRSGTFYNHHLTVSFRESTRFNSEDALNRAFDAVKRLMGEINVSAGYAVYHSWRIREEYRGEVNGHDSGGGDMTWSDVLEKIESESWCWEAAREEFLVYAPHFHVIGVSEFAQTGAVTEQIEEETGVVIHRITKGDDSSVSLYDLNDLCSVSAYALSHACLSADESGETYRAAYRPFGEVANFTPTPGVEAEVDGTMREVAPDVLGVRFEKPECDAERVEEDEIEEGGGAAVRALAAGGESEEMGDATGPDRWGDSTGAAAFSQSATGDAWAATQGVEPDFASEPPASITERCGARLRPTRAAPEYLGSLDWRGSVGEETVGRLEEAFREWRERGEPELAAPPPD